MYNSISDAIKENPMSRLSLQTASNNNTVHNGFLWKISGKSFFCKNKIIIIS
jgi:hypothetical protein